MRTPNPAIEASYCCVLPASASLYSSKASFVLPCRKSVSHFPYSLIPFHFPFFLSSSPTPLLFSLPFSLSLLIIFSMLMAPKKSTRKKLSNEEMHWLTITQSSFQLSKVAVRKNCSSPKRIVHGCCFWVFVSNSIAKIYSVEVVSSFLDVPAGGTQRLCFCSGGHRRP